MISAPTSFPPAVWDRVVCGIDGTTSGLEAARQGKRASRGECFRHLGHHQADDHNGDEALLLRTLTHPVCRCHRETPHRRVAELR